MRLAPLVALCAVGGAAWGDGRPAAPVWVALEPAPGRRILLGTTVGLLAGDDAGGPWRWICEEAIGVTGTPGASDSKYLISPAGTWFAALPNGLSVSRDHGCSWQLAGPPLAGAWVKDIAVSPLDPQTLYVVTSTTAAPNGLYVSHDDGRSFIAVPPRDPVAFYWRVVAQGADAFLSGYDDLASGHQHLWKYSSGGNVVPQQATGLSAAMPTLLYFGAAQRTPGLVYLSAKVGSADAIFRSTDGGARFTEIYRSPAVGAALLGENDVLWLASGRELLSSTDGGRSFHGGPTERSLHCLGQRAGTLWGCVEDAGGLALARSRDGSTWTGALRFQDLAGPLGCPTGSLTHDLCQPLWPGLANQLGLARDDHPEQAPPSAPGGSVGPAFAIGAAVMLLFALYSAFNRHRGPKGGPS